MKDYFLALMGPKHCGWCMERGDTLIDRLCRFNIALRWSERRWYEKAIMRIERFWTDRAPFWKLGQTWHYRHHTDWKSFPK